MKIQSLVGLQLLGALALVVGGCTATTTEEPSEQAPQELAAGEVCTDVYVEDEPPPDAPLDPATGLVTAVPTAGPAAPGASIRPQGRWKRLCQTFGKCVSGTNPIGMLTAARDSVIALTKSLEALTKRITELAKTIDARKAAKLDTRHHEQQLATLQKEQLGLDAALKVAQEKLALIERSYKEYLSTCKYWEITP